MTSARVRHESYFWAPAIDFTSMAVGEERFHATPAKILAILQRTLPPLGMSIAQVAPNGVVAKTGVGLRSLGETITVVLHPEGGSTRVEVVSETKVQLFDWGKGDENVQAVVAAIRSNV